MKLTTAETPQNTELLGATEYDKLRTEIDSFMKRVMSKHKDINAVGVCFSWLPTEELQAIQNRPAAFFVSSTPQLTLQQASGLHTSATHMSRHAANMLANTAQQLAVENTLLKDNAKAMFPELGDPPTEAQLNE